MFCASTPYLFFIVHFDNAEHTLLVIFVVFDVGVTLRFASWYFTLSLHCATARYGGRVCSVFVRCVTRCETALM